MQIGNATGRYISSDATTQPGTAVGSDAQTKNIQNQIKNAQKQLQNLEANDKLSIEDKMTRYQEIRKRIDDLQNQLRQHQLTLRKEKQMPNHLATDKGLERDNTYGAIPTNNDAPGMSSRDMKAIISGNTAIKKVKTIENVATALKGSARILQSEIKIDKSRGMSTERKEKKLAAIQEKASERLNSQLKTLADANKKMKEAASEDANTNTENTLSTKNESAAMQTIDEMHKVDEMVSADRGQRTDKMKVSDKVQGESSAIGFHSSASENKMAMERERLRGSKAIDIKI